jgi:hypothetical protein
LDGVDDGARWFVGHSDKLLNQQGDRRRNRQLQRDTGCGAMFKTIQAGWSLGIRCGGENIVVAEKTLAGAEQAARGREVELRQLYVPDMPSCRRVVAVDPTGSAVVSQRQHHMAAGRSPR